MEKILRLFASGLLFAFSAILFPSFYNATANATSSSPALPVLKVFPYLFLAVCLLIFVYELAQNLSKRGG